MRIETSENDKKNIIKIAVIAGASADGIIAAIIAYQVVLGIQQEDERIRLERETQERQAAQQQAYCDQ
jgi:hypothetical protein